MNESIVIVITFLTLIGLFGILALKYGADSRQMDNRPNL